jgi:hypothetical protein
MANGKNQIANGRSMSGTRGEKLALLLRVLDANRRLPSIKELPMAQIISPIPPDIGPLFIVNFKSIRLTAAQFEQLCSDNRDLRLELTFEGELIVMPPAGSKTGFTKRETKSKTRKLDRL